jgi:MFS family permease
LLAIGLMWLTANHFQTVFWIAVIPAFLSVAVLLVMVKEPTQPQPARRVRIPLHWHELRRLGAPYWWMVAIATVFTLARFSEAFLILKAQSIGLPVMLVPLALVLMNLPYSLSAYPIGRLSDRMDRLTILTTGLLLLICADVILAFTQGIFGAGVGVMLWGLHMGFTQGLFAKLVADTSPADLRGTAFGLFNLITGLALLLASLIAGFLWDASGPRGTFLAGAGFAALTLISLLAIRHRFAATKAA